MNENANNETNDTAPAAPAIDPNGPVAKALALAKAKAEARAAMANGKPALVSPPRGLTESELAQRLARKKELEEAARARREIRAKEVAEKKAKREAERAARGPAHTAKLKKVEAALPPLDEAAKEVFDMARDLPAADLNALAQHLAFAARKAATLGALGATATLKVGDYVKINNASGADARYIGQLGELVEVRRIRCFVQLPDRDRPIYLFTSDVSHADLDSDSDSDSDSDEVVVSE